MERQPNSKQLCQNLDAQHRATKLISSLKNLSYLDRLKRLKLLIIYYVHLNKIVCLADHYFHP